MKQIPLTQGKFALVDDADYEWLNRLKWNASKENAWYAMRTKGVRMHRLILGLKPNDGKQVDHIDGNGLNNQRSNLRVCTNQQNCFNRRGIKGSSIFKGVHKRNKGIRRWAATIGIDGRQICLGHYSLETEAAKVYDKKAKELFGEFAFLNFPEEVE